MAKAAKKPRPKGRPSKLTPELQDAICDAIGSGMPDNKACASQGLHIATFCRWMERGEGEASGPYREFREAVMRARGRRPAAMMAKLADAVSEDWRAGEAYLKLLEARARREQNADLQRRKLEAECDRAEAEARRANAIADGKGGAAVMVMPEEALRLIPEAMRPAFEAALRAGGVGLVVERDLCAGVTPEDVAAACPGEG